MILPWAVAGPRRRTLRAWVLHGGPRRRNPDPRNAGQKAPFDEQPPPYPGIEERMQEAPDFSDESRYVNGEILGVTGGKVLA